MDNEKIKEIIKGAKEGAPNKESAELVEGFEEFLSMQQRQKELTDPKDKEIYGKQLEDSRNKVWVLLERTALSFGFNMEQFQQYMANASNFSPQQWQAMESFKEEQLNIKKRSAPSFMKRRKRQLLKA